jgi:hypothetical protein
MISVPGSIPKIIFDGFCKEEVIFDRAMALLSKNIKRFFNYYLGPLLFIWLSWSIYYQVKNQPDLELSWKKVLLALESPESWKFWMIFLLMGANWGVEARKFQVLLRPAERIGLWRSLKATLAGVAFAMNTPNRIGEYGGRILYVHEGNRIKAVSLTIAGSFSQFITTLLMGWCGLLFLLNIQVPATNPHLAGSYMFWVQVMIYIVSAASVLALIVYFKLGWLVNVIEKVPAFKWLAPHISVLEELSFFILLRVLSLSFTRYVIFVAQYILMLQLLQVDVTVWQAFWLTTVMFLVLAIVPSIALADIGIRGKVSLELFGLFSLNKLGIIAASVSMWAINLVIPALMGSILILRIKIFKNK